MRDNWLLKVIVALLIFIFVTMMFIQHYLFEINFTLEEISKKLDVSNNSSVVEKDTLKSKR